MNMDRNTVSRPWRAAVTLVANLVADWDEQEASRVTALWPPSPRHRSTTLPWRLTMHLTVHSFRTSDGVIATEEA